MYKIDAKAYARMQSTSNGGGVKRWGSEETKICPDRKVGKTLLRMGLRLDFGNRQEVVEPPAST